MTTFGTVICHPADKFSTPRSYIEGIIASTQNQPFTWDGYNLRIAVADPVVFWMNVHFNHKFMNWNSNYYTLDYVVDEIFYDVNGGPSHNPFTAHLYWGYHTGFKGASLLLDLFPLLPPYSLFTLQAAPADYWMPRFPP